MSTLDFRPVLVCRKEKHLEIQDDLKGRKWWVQW